MQQGYLLTIHTFTYQKQFSEPVTENHLYQDPQYAMNQFIQTSKNLAKKVPHGKYNLQNIPLPQHRILHYCSILDPSRPQHQQLVNDIYLAQLNVEGPENIQEETK